MVGGGNRPAGCMFSASVLIKRQGRPRQWGHHLSVMETINKLAVTPRCARPHPLCLSWESGSGPSYPLQYPTSCRTPSACGPSYYHLSPARQMPRCSSSSKAPAAPSFCGIQVDGLMHDQGHLDDQEGLERRGRKARLCGDKVPRVSGVMVQW